MSTLGGLGAALGPLADVTKKAAKAQQVKSVKAKVKVKFGKDKSKPDSKDAS